MDNHQTFLITMTDEAQLLRVALKITIGMLTGDADLYPLEPENKEQFKKLLPAHCQMNIVEVKEIFDAIISI